MSSFLPPSSGGFLPYWLLFLGGAGTYNALQSYVVQWQTKEVYGGKPHEITPLAGRLFGTWTLLASIIRFKAAYSISDPTLYDICHYTYFIVTAHFLSEFLLFKTVKVNRASVWPLVFGATTAVWMYVQRGFYLGL